MVGAIEVVSPGHGWRYLKFWLVPIAAVYWPAALRVTRRTYGAERMEAEKRGETQRPHRRFDASGAGAAKEWWLRVAFFTAGVVYLAWWLGWITGIWRRLFRAGEDLI